MAKEISAQAKRDVEKSSANTHLTITRDTERGGIGSTEPPRALEKFLNSACQDGFICPFSSSLANDARAELAILVNAKAELEKVIMEFNGCEHVGLIEQLENSKRARLSTFAEGVEAAAAIACSLKCNYRYDCKMTCHAADVAAIRSLLTPAHLAALSRERELRVLEAKLETLQRYCRILNWVNGSKSLAETVRSEYADLERQIAAIKEHSSEGKPSQK